MALKNCVRCKTLFNSIGRERKCPRCKQLEEEEFDKVRVYLRKYPKSTLAQTSEETGVSKRLITRFIREGRLEIASDSGIGIECERCGKMIQTGYYCPQCSMDIQKGLSKSDNLRRDRVSDMDLKAKVMMHSRRRER